MGDSLPMRKLLVHNQIASSEFANCGEIHEIPFLTISSRREVGTNQQESLESVNVETMQKDAETMECTTNFQIITASYIEKEVQEQTKCMHCATVFGENEKIHNEYIKLKMKTENIQQPCKDTIQLMKIVDAAAADFPRTEMNRTVFNKILEKTKLAVDNGIIQVYTPISNKIAITIKHSLLER